MRVLKVIPAVADICSHLTGQRRQPGGELVTKEGKLGEYSKTAGQQLLDTGSASDPECK